MFLLVAFLIFSGALAAAGYFVWSVPRQQENEILTARLRELRAPGGSRTRIGGDLRRREQRSALAPLADFFAWVDLLRRLQQYIDQANLKYRAPEVFGLSLIVCVL